MIRFFIKVVFKYVFLGLILLLSLPGNTQDLLVIIEGDSINCKILEVKDDSLMFRAALKGSLTDTRIPMSRISKIQPGYYVRINADTTIYYQIETIDGNVYMGQILSQEGKVIRVRTVNIGDISLKPEDIQNMKRVDAALANSDGSRWFDYLQSSRYFYAPSGYGLRKGDSYYQNVWILFNQFSYGFSDNFSAGIGMVPLFLFDGAATPVWLTPKLSIPVVEDKFNLGLGALLGGVIGLGEYSSEGFGVIYGIATVGDRNKNLSLGLGYGYAAGNFAQSPAISISGMLPLGKRNFLITENYLIDSIGLISLGGRSLIKKVTLDYGLFIPADQGAFFAIPWLGIVIPVTQGLK